MSSLKRQQDESSTVTPSSSSEPPSKKAKVAGTGHLDLEVFRKESHSLPVPIYIDPDVERPRNPPQTSTAYTTTSNQNSPLTINNTVTSHLDDSFFDDINLDEIVREQLGKTATTSENNSARNSHNGSSSSSSSGGGGGRMQPPAVDHKAEVDRLAAESMRITQEISRAVTAGNTTTVLYSYHYCF